ncbi:MAG: hypothetical protein KJP00_16380, partial [Bacteroidia bacterium]|nr:hypothetical protein [Bacteroidia bacterium]
SSHSLTSGKNLAFSSISLTYPGNRTLYQYWIDRGEDTDWIDTDNPDRTLIEIDDPDIQGLKIRARKAGGHAWSDPLEIPLIVQLPWYKRKTNIFLLSILGVSLLALFWRSNNKRFRRQITDLESLLHAKNAPPDKEENKGEILYEPSAGSDPQNELLTASMHLIYTVTNHIDAGMKWDHMLEQLSIATMKLPHTVAFEIGTLRKKSNKIIIDGYAHSKQVFYNREESWSEPLSIFKHGIKAQKGEIIKGNIPNQDILSKWTGKFNSVILVPFLLGRKRYAAIAIYGDEKLQNEHVLKAIQSVANYLELIH